MLNFAFWGFSEVELRIDGVLRSSRVINSRELLARCPWPKNSFRIHRAELSSSLVRTRLYEGEERRK
jgi:hypothetical protein